MGQTHFEYCGQFWLPHLRRENGSKDDQGWALEPKGRFKYMFSVYAEYV